MATQASAITFISIPGQAYESGMGFIQIYLGLPLAMIVISAVFIPIFYKLNVYTAYEYLEERFNLKTRHLISFLFLISRGLATAISIYAPAIILSTLFGWNLSMLCLIMGIVVIIYTYAGGEVAVSKTQALQMVIIWGGMITAFIMLICALPKELSIGDAAYLAAKLGKLEMINWKFDAGNRYNIWSGIIGGFFLSLSYFGTDQSQVSRYLGGSSINESKMGLFFNGLLKIPMQLLILMVGVLTFLFFLFHPSPVFFNQKALQASEINAELQYKLKAKEHIHNRINTQKQNLAFELIKARGTSMEASAGMALQKAEAEDQKIKTEYKSLIKTHLPNVETRDADYVFLNYILNYLPVGLIGLLMAVMFSAAMSSMSGQINSLATASAVDFYKRSINPQATEKQFVRASKVCTLIWGAITVGFALSASLFDNLIQAVNIVGSLFYGTILGVFLVAFFLKQIGGRAVFIAALCSQFIILAIHILGEAGIFKIAFLWYNLLGPALVISISFILELAKPKLKTTI